MKITNASLAWLAVIDRIRVAFELDGRFDRWQCCNKLRMKSVGISNGQLMIDCCPSCHQPSFSPGKYGRFPSA